MSLYTRIRGLQIKDSDIDTLQLKDDAVTNDKLANITRGSVKVGGAADAPTDLDAKTDKQILIGDGTDVVSVAVSGDITIGNTGAVTIGATKVVDTMLNDDVATGLAGDGLAATTGVIALDLNELTEAAVAVATDSIVFIDSDGSVSRKETIADLATAMAGTGLTATAGVLAADAVADNIIEADILKEDETVACNGSNVEFTLSETPIANSVQVYLNGSLMQDGSGKDYEIVGTTITFGTAPADDDSLIIHYFKDD